MDTIDPFLYENREIDCQYAVALNWRKTRIGM